MRVAVTGTPGTGKSTATNRLETDLDVIHLNEEIRARAFDQGTDDERGSLIADLDAVRGWLDGRDHILIESHLAHHLHADRVVVLRAHPETIQHRLRAREEGDATAFENAESEALDVILSAAVETHGADAVYEIDTTEKDPAEVADEIAAVIRGDREPRAGTVSYLDWL
jgi:adenylate kinase